MNKGIVDKIKEVKEANTDENITTIAIEELGELIQALSKYKRWCNKDLSLRAAGHDILENVREELADTYLLLEQIKIILNIDNHYINSKIIEKIERTLDRIRTQND